MAGSAFVWPLNASPVPDEMNTSFGPRIDANRWDFHDGIDLPARVGTLVHAMANGVVHRVGPADKTDPNRGFGSTHVVLRVVDPTDGQNDLYLVYLHLDCVARAVIPDAPVLRGDVIGAVGQEDATYPHLHFEFRKGGPESRRSVHPLRYLPYTNTTNVTNLHLDRCNVYEGGSLRAIRLRFSLPDRREGDLQTVAVMLSGNAVAPRSYRVDLDDRDTIVSGKGDELAFTNGIAVEGYQKSNLKGDNQSRLRYGVIVKDVPGEYDSGELTVGDARHAHTSQAAFSLPTLGTSDAPVHRVTGFEGQTFPPNGWQQQVLPGNTCHPAAAAALSGTRGLLCEDAQTAGALVRAALSSAVPAGRMSWRLRADVKPVDLQMPAGRAIYPLAFLGGGDLVAAACLRKVGDDYFAGVLIRTVNGMFRELIDVEEGQIAVDQPVKWELDILRLATSQTTAVVRVNQRVVARLNGDTVAVEPDAACAGILHRHAGLQITLHLDQLALTEEPR
jgi:hypothetical protein